MSNLIKIGDYITFRAATRWSCAKARRKVNGFCLGQPTVRYGGWDRFEVRPDEILKVEAA